MSASISIRRATERDFEAIARLTCDLGYAVNPRTMRVRIQAILASAADLLIVAEDSSHTVLGWLQAHAAHVVESGFRVEITGLIVATDSRRQGVGRSMVAHVERWGRSISAKAVVVRSNIKRVESHSFYP